MLENLATGDIFRIFTMLEQVSTGVKIKVMNGLEHRLWNERGYDIPYLEELTHKELIALYDTEFYIEDN